MSRRMTRRSARRSPTWPGSLRSGRTRSRSWRSTRCSGSPDGRSAAFEVAVAACRQNIKTGIFKQAALGWLFVTGERLVVWSAHEWDTVKEAFRDLEELITGSDYLRREVKNIYRGNGDEAIELLSGAAADFQDADEGRRARPVRQARSSSMRGCSCGRCTWARCCRRFRRSRIRRCCTGRRRHWRSRRCCAGSGSRPGGRRSAAGVYRVLRAAAGAGVRAGRGVQSRAGRPGCGCDDPANWAREYRRWAGGGRMARA